MKIILLSAVGIGGATLVGSLLGFIFRSLTMRYSGIVLSFSAGIMLAAAISGLIEPAFADGGLTILLALFGLFLGAVALALIERYVPLSAVGDAKGAILFAIAIAIHNLPEGIAAGIGFAGDDVAGAVAVAVGIALHNIPEGMIVIAPLLASHIGLPKTAFFALSGGLAEVVGTFLGYFSAKISLAMLPLALSFAGGTMLYAIVKEMIPESQEFGASRATFSLISGFAVMMSASALIG